jgi:Holliday junction resolvase-like predicted endonuclease
MKVQKATGEIEKFDEDKLCHSMVLAGAPKDTAEKVCQLVKNDISPSVNTNHIFRKAFSHLVKKDMDIAVRYSLRRALERLGPAGFLFEQYVEAVFQAHGYKTRRNQIVQGACVDHEIDVEILEKNKTILVEVKYRNEPGIKTHLDTVMYADARRMDIQEYQKKKGEQYDVWLVTNTKYTDKALQYGECKNQVKLIGWDYPKGRSLEDMIVEKKVFPVTSLPYITNHILQQFAEAEIILVSDLIPYTPEKLIKKFGMNEKRARGIIRKVKEIIN